MIGTSLSLTCKPSAQARVGDHFSLTVSASGSSSPTITVRGLPLGLTAHSGLGRVTISGTPLVIGRRKVQIMARDKSGVVSRVLVLNVQPRQPRGQDNSRWQAGSPWEAAHEPSVVDLVTPVEIVPRSETVDQGSYVGVRISALGSPRCKLSVRGPLPPGLHTRTLSGSIVLSGIPVSSGTHKIAVIAEKDATTTLSTFTLHVLPHRAEQRGATPYTAA